MHWATLATYWWSITSNHFTATSFRNACTLAGLEVESIDQSGFYGALAIVAGGRSTLKPRKLPKAWRMPFAGLRSACAMWTAAHSHLMDAVDQRKGRKVGCAWRRLFTVPFTMQRIGAHDEISIILDGNPHLQGGTFFDRPIVAPVDIPADVDGVFVALNPAIARGIVASGEIYGRPGIDLVFFR